MAEKEATLLIKIKQTGAEVLQKTTSVLKDLGKAAVAFFAAASAATVKAIDAYKEQEEAVNALNRSLVNQGIFTKELSAQYQDLADQLQKKSKFGDEEIIQSQAILQGYAGQKTLTAELVQATLDLAQAKGIDLRSASELVGKALTGNDTALKKMGISMAQNVTESQRMAAVTQVLESRFKGQAEAATRGLGQLSVLKNVSGELFESVGEALAPIIGVLTKVLIEMGDQLQTNTGFMSGLISVIDFTATGAIRLWQAFSNVGGVIGAVLAPAVASVASLMEGQFKQAADQIGQIYPNIASVIEESEKTANDRIDAIQKARLDSVKAKQEEEIALINESNARKDAIREERAAIDASFFEIQNTEELIKQQAQFDLLNSQEDMNRLTQLNNEIKHSQNKEAVLDAHYKKRALMTQAQYDAELKMAIRNGDFLAAINSRRVKDFENTMNNLSQLQNSKSKELVAIGKAAALAQITVDTARGAVSAYAALAPIPIVGPALGAIAAGALIAYGAERAAQVSGVTLAEGGIVRSTPGGVRATLAEAGQDEAVIPLDEAGQGMLSNNITIIVNGGMLGDENSARELALAIDRQLLKLRQSNQSLAFDSGVI